MSSKFNATLLVSAIGASVLATGTLLSQQPAAPPGTTPQPPHTTPQPAHTQPGTAPRPNQNPTPTPVPNQPGTIQNPAQPNAPAQPANPQNPNQPAQPGQAQPGELDPVLPTLPDPNDPNLTPEQRAAILKLRTQQPFAFASPQAEARFNDTARRLARFEQRLERSNQDQLKRLGEIRAMSAERQGPAMFDLLQQMLTTQRDLQRYLVAARVNMTGEFDLPSETIAGANGAQPAANPGTPATR
jgi:hypothetical protein